MVTVLKHYSYHFDKATGSFRKFSNFSLVWLISFKAYIYIVNPGSIIEVRPFLKPFLESRIEGRGVSARNWISPFFG